MKKFNPDSMPDTTSPTVRSLRTFVERSIENEVENIEALYGEETGKIVEKSLRAVVLRIFHKNPEVHTAVKDDMFVFDSAIQTLFGIAPITNQTTKE